MANTWYNVQRDFVDYSRASVRYIAAELSRIAQGFDKLPTKNQLSGNVHIVASEKSTSAANAYIFESTYAVDELVSGLQVKCIMTNTNTGASTLKLDELLQKSVKNIDGSALVGSEIVAGWPHEFMYNGTDWLLLNSAKRITAGIVLDAALTPRNFSQNAAITAFTLPAASGGSTPYIYSASGLPSGLAFSTTTRQVSGTPTTLGSSTVTYTVTDSNALVFNFQFVINIVASALQLTAPQDRTLTVGNEYSFTLPAATDGISPYIYAIEDNVEGMSFDPESRELSGSPTSPGVVTVTYLATDSGTTVQTASQTFDLTVRAAAALALGAVTDKAFEPNASITPFTLPTATGGVPDYTYIVTGLGEGLNFDEVTREVSGTPTTTGTRAVTYRVEDSEGTQRDQEFDIVVSFPGRRYITVLTSRTNITAAQLQSGNDFSPSAGELDLPSWTGDRYIVIAQPEDNDDLIHISLSGVGNSISAFEKASYTRTINGIDYEIWVGREVQGGAAISGQIIEVQS